MGSDLSLESGLQPGDMPAIQRAAEASSGRGQRTYLRWTRARLFLVVIAAAAGIVRITVHINDGRIDIAAAVAVICFVLALVVEIYLLTNKPEQVWYRGRAVAESLKTLSWRYAMRAEPFAGDEEIVSRFMARIREVVSESSVADELGIAQGQQITERMRLLRSSDFAARKQAYLAGRIDDQIGWYKNKAERNGRLANVWRGVLLLLEFGGIVGALLLLMEVTSVSVDGILASMIAASGAWLEVKQFESLSTAYALTATELQLASEDGVAVTSEQDWSGYVRSAEEAISREHTMWLARRTRPALKRL